MAERHAWDVEFYEDAKGAKPVEAFIGKLPLPEQAQIARAIVRLKTFGLALGQPHVKPIEGRLWELRPGPHRIFYFAYTGHRFVLLHGYRKKSAKAPRREIEAALRRMEDHIRRYP